MGSLNALCCLGVCYEYGTGTVKNEKQAFSLYQKAADYGSPRGQMLLSRAYHDGIGTEPDREQALYWVRTAAYQKYGEAMHRLGVCYEYGDGIEQSWEHGFGLRRKMALPPL